METEKQAEGFESDFSSPANGSKVEYAMRTLAAIPAYDEEVAIGSVVLRCGPYVDHVLVVDDGSEDRTADIAKLANASVIRHAKNLGKGAAIQSALRFARANGFGAMVLLDGDGQHDPTDIPDLLKSIEQDEADIVVGVRKRSTSRMPVYRRFGQRILDVLTAAGTQGTVTDSQSGFRALSRTAIESLDLEERDFGIESEMLIEAKDKNLRIAEVPIQARYDVEGSTKGPLSHGFGLVDRLLRIIAVRHPLFFFGALGAAMIIIGLFFGFLALPVYPSFPDKAFGYSFIVVIFLTIGVLGVMAGIMLNVLPKAVARTLRGSAVQQNGVQGKAKRSRFHEIPIVNRILEAIGVRHPLLVFGFSGIAALVIGVLLGINALGLYPHNPQLAIAYSFLVILSVISGVLALHTAIVLNVLPRAVARNINERGAS